MAEQVLTKLPDALYEQLQTETLVLLHTIDAESQFPTSSAISWVCATNNDTVRIALDQRSRLVKNIEQNDHVTLSVFSGGTIYSITGIATIATELLKNVPIEMVCIDVSVQAVRESMFYASRITVRPEFEKVYDKRAADKLDDQVFTALRKA